MAVERALERGAETVQIFSSSPRTWRRSPLEPPAAGELVRALRAHDVGPLFLHAPYLVNLASPSSETRKLSRRALEADMDRAAQLHTAGLVVHGGSSAGDPRPDALRRQARALLRILGEDAGGPRLLIELTAGAPGHLASRFPEAAEMLDACHGHPRLGICIDTCHLHAAGYDLSGPAGVAEAVGELRRKIGLRRLGLVHANDSRDLRGSRRDRHWHVGEGAIGREGFQALMAHPGLRAVPFVCETPGDLVDDRRNVGLLKELRALAGRPPGPAVRRGGIPSLPAERRPQPPRST